MNRTRLDVPRLIAILSVGSAVLAGALVYVTFEPQIESLHERVDDARSALRSGDTLVADADRLRAERAAYERRYARLFAQNPQALFVRDLAATARRHDVDVVGSATGHERIATNADADRAFKRVPLTLQLRGTYRNLLASIADLSRGEVVVDVDTPSLQRDGDAVVASVPVAIVEPDPVER